MPSVRIWVPESDYDEKAVEHLAIKAVAYLQASLTIHTAGAGAYKAVGRKIQANPRALITAVEQYLKQDDYLLFVIDRDSSASLEKRKQERFSKINLINTVVNSNHLQGRVYIALAIEEIEAWLLVDCIGICGYFAGKDCSEAARSKYAAAFHHLIRKYQRGNTESITEAVSGGKNAKEYLVNFSEAIIRQQHPAIRHDTLDRIKYQERFSPELAKCVQVTTETLNRNPSFAQFVKILQYCATRSKMPAE